MSGCGFAKAFVINYMEELVEEYRDAQKTLAKIEDELIGLD